MKIISIMENRILWDSISMMKSKLRSESTVEVALTFNKHVENKLYLDYISINS